MLGCMVTIGTWNLENLFRPGEGSGPDSSTEYEKKLESLAETITNLGPDVLAVQEVGDPAALEDLAGKLQRTWRTVLADPDGRGIRVGFLSRSAVTKVEEIVDFPEGFSPVQINDKGETIEQMGRLVLKVRVRKDGAMFDIVSVHLKSKLLSYPGGRFSPRDEGERTRYSVYALHRGAAEAITKPGWIDEDPPRRSGSQSIVLCGNTSARHRTVREPDRRGCIKRELSWRTFKSGPSPVSFETS